MRFTAHDSDAVSDPKVQRLLATCGPAAYGLYWVMVEAMVRDEGAVHVSDLASVAYMAHMPVDVAEGMVGAMVDVGLLVETGDGWLSERAAKEVEHYRDTAAKRSAAARKRWDKAR